MCLPSRIVAISMFSNQNIGVRSTWRFGSTTPAETPSFPEVEQTQELNFSQSMSIQLKDGITKRCQNEGSHVKLVQAGQSV